MIKLVYLFEAFVHTVFIVKILHLAPMTCCAFVETQRKS